MLTTISKESIIKHVPTCDLEKRVEKKWAKKATLSVETTVSVLIKKIKK